MGRISQAQATVKSKGKGDIVFCIDSTGSMQPCIDGVKAHVQDFVRNLKTDGQTPLDWRAKVVGFRDVWVDADPLVGLENPWVTDEAGIKGQLDMLIADGGGDSDESLLDAFYKIITVTAWEPDRHRIVVLFTDAPSKPEMNPSTLGGQGDLTVNTVLDAALTEHIKVFYFGPQCSTLEPLEKDLPKSVFEYVEGAGLTTVDFKNILSQLAKTVSMAASRGVVAGKSSGAL